MTETFTDSLCFNFAYRETTGLNHIVLKKSQAVFVVLTLLGVFALEQE